MSCTHVAELPPEPAVDCVSGCAECVELGETGWVHLRKCLTCGHIACCDSSPYRHATGHFHKDGHPVMRSYEPGESWRWCYVDNKLV
ncbi:hypothetical protein DMH04_46810 [Kibdelosporangium aridum]|uniref:UBP-type domain-containing protein n=1 Tax=Kibdelosporangium aridum TaxID=2030 RepID=A0A428YLW1_KIBAR|nr:UBP-type zinc finger domain-containing protein [Kibdelosporangium aridum]RSM68898.1 hypothetical protein DMH04_46810 [Kibdelosporangium aridum]